MFVLKICTPPRRVSYAAGFVAAIVMMCSSLRAASPAAEFHPADPIFYASANGELEYLGEFKNTALYQAVYDSGLAATFQKTFNEIIRRLNIARLDEVIRHINDNGLSISVSADPFQPNNPAAIWVTIVADSGGEGVGVFSTVVEAIADHKVPIRTTRIQNRTVNSIEIPESNVELTWRSEGEHLVLTVGMKNLSTALKNSVDVAAGTRDSMLKSPVYQALTANAGQGPLTQISFFDFSKFLALWDSIDIPVNGRSPLKVREVTDALGLSNLKLITSRGGIDGVAVWNEFSVQVDGERKGLLSLMDQEALSLSELPKIPAAFTAVSAQKLNALKTFQVLVQGAKNVADLFPEVGSEKVVEALATLKSKLGISGEEFLKSIGDLNVTIVDQSGGPLSIGLVSMTRLNDSATFKTSFRTLASNIMKLVDEQAPEKGMISLKEDNQGDVTSFQLVLTKLPLYGLNLTVSNDWVLIGPSTQAIKAQLMRMDGKLPSISLSDVKEVGGAAVPETFQSIAVVDPRPGIQAAISFAPTLGALIESGLRSQGILSDSEPFPFDYGNLPPAEAVTMYLFHSVSFGVNDGGVQKVKTRSSMPF